MRAGLHGVALAVLAALPSAYAQQAVEKVERIEITGSRIAASSDVESASPIAVIKAEDIKLEGFQSIELVLNNFPQFSPDQGNRISNGATGTATANLRGLGAQRTLVLLNGKRLPSGSPFVLAPDLNQVPMQLIQRVEILTGGASAVYGSDAIAGVVNFILNDHYEGVQGEVAYDFYNHQQHNEFVSNLVRAHGYTLPGDKSADASSTSADLTIGGNFAQDKGNATVSFRYFKSEALLQSERDYSACSLTLTRTRLRQPVCGGSPTGYPGQFQNFGAVQPDLTQPVLSLTMDRKTGAVRDYVNATDDFNFGPDNYYQRPQERYGFTAFANYQIAPDARVYGEFGYHDDHTVAQLAPSGIFGLESQVRYDNPLLTDAWRSHLMFLNPDGTAGSGPGTTADMMIFRRNVDGGGRQIDLRLVSFREVVGVKGTVAGRWDYDAYFQQAHVNYAESFQRNFSNTRILRALNVVTDPATGAPVCASVLDGTDPKCVPYNVWTPNGVTPAALAYLDAGGLQRALMTQQIMGGTLSANLGDYGIRLPRTTAGIEVALGVERRTEKLDFESDTETASGDLAGSGAPSPPVHGGFTVKDLFGEVRVPIGEAVNVNGSYRHSDYDTGVKTNTYGIGLNVSPHKALRVRGSYQRAIRAPDVNELFTPRLPDGYGLGDSDNPGDPCEGLAPSRSLADCRRTGVTAANYGHILVNPIDGYPATSGGNTGLNPEKATTTTAGVVLTPWRDFSATIDYFDVRIDDTISSIDGTTIFQQCIDTGDPFFCNLITRDPSGVLWKGTGNVLTINQNIGKVQATGTDVAVNYRLRLPAGHSVAFDGMGTYLLRQSIGLYPGAPSIDCAGYFASSCQTVPLPKWRHRLRTTWQPPSSFELAATWRYIGGTTLAPESSGPGLPAQFTRLPSVGYLDLSGTWNATKWITLRAGVNNVADKDPPLSLGFSIKVNGNAFAQMYDVLGRHVFVSATARF